MASRKKYGSLRVHRAQAEDPELFAALEAKKLRDNTPIRTFFAAPIEKSRCRCMGTCAGCSKPIESDKRAVMERLLADWEATPDMRLGQFLTQVVCSSTGDPADLFDIPDNDLVDAARKYRRR